MTLNKSSRNPFASMFWNSVKRTLFVPIATLVMFILAILTDFIAELISRPDYSVNEYSYYNKYGYFWDNIFFKHNTRRYNHDYFCNHLGNCPIQICAEQKAGQRHLFARSQPQENFPCEVPRRNCSACGRSHLFGNH